MKLAFVFFSMILVNNYVLVKFLGMCPFLGVSKNPKSARGISMALILVLFVSSVITWPLYTFVLMPLKLEYLENILFVLVISVVVQALDILMAKFMPELHRSLGVYLPLLTTNCAILGFTLLSVQTASVVNPQQMHYTFVETIVAALGVGLGFALAMFLFSGVQRRLRLAKPPKPFQGLPLTLISAGIVSLSFMGFGGLLETLFGISI